MKKEQLLEAKKVTSKIELVEKTINRAGTTGLGWNQNDYFYKFSVNEFSDNQSLINIFSEVSETARILLMNKLDNYKKELETEFESI